MSTETNKAIVKQVLEALDRREYDGLAIHPGLVETMRRQPLIRRAFPDLQTRVELQVAEGDMVATMATIRGTHLGEFMGVLPTRQKMSWNVLLMDQIVGDRIVLHYANADWLGLLLKLEILPPPPRPISQKIRR
jgi:predicted ester cyclase